MQVARHSGEAPRRRGWAAEPSFRAFAPGGDSARRIDPREPQPGVNSLWGKPGFPHRPPPRLPESRSWQSRNESGFAADYAPIASTWPGACSYRTWRIVATARMAPTNEIAAPTYRAWW